MRRGTTYLIQDSQIINKQVTFTRTARCSRVLGGRASASKLKLQYVNKQALTPRCFEDPGGRTLSGATAVPDGNSFGEACIWIQAKEKIIIIIKK